MLYVSSFAFFASPMPMTCRFQHHRRFFYTPSLAERGNIIAHISYQFLPVFACILTSPPSLCILLVFTRRSGLTCTSRLGISCLRSPIPYLESQSFHGHRNPIKAVGWCWRIISYIWYIPVVKCIPNEAASSLTFSQNNRTPSLSIIRLYTCLWITIIIIHQHLVAACLITTTVDPHLHGAHRCGPWGMCPSAPATWHSPAGWWRSNHWGYRSGWPELQTLVIIHG